MAIESPLPIVSVEGVLKLLGFKPGGEWPSQLTYDFGNLELRALPCTNEYLRPAVLFSGIYRTPQSIRQISFEMPEKVESALQVQAWIAHGVGDGFKPGLPCTWFEEGCRSKDLLPWERHMRAYEDRPLVWVPRTWMRLAAEELRQAAEGSPEGQVCTVRFDGRTFEFDLGRRVIPLPAEGKRPWEHVFPIRLKRLSSLPRRWMMDPIPVDVWEEKIRFGRISFELTEQDQPFDPP